jgi:hypothetical protein
MATTPETNKSPLPPRLPLRLNGMETDGSNESDIATRIPVLQCNDNESRNTVDDTEVAGREEELSRLPPYQNGVAAVSVSAVLDAEVVEERDLQQEVQERMNNITIEATSVVNLSSKKDQNNHDRGDSRPKSTTVMLIVAAALIILIIIAPRLCEVNLLLPW